MHPDLQRKTTPRLLASFEGTIQPSISQAAYITFCTFLGLGSTALVLAIVLPEVGNWWYALTLASPLAGQFYWSQAERNELVRVKMVTRYCAVPRGGRGRIAPPRANIRWLRTASRSFPCTDAYPRHRLSPLFLASDDDVTTEVRLEGDKEEIERFRRSLNMMEKDMIYVKGLFEQ